MSKDKSKKNSHSSDSLKQASDLVKKIHYFIFAAILITIIVLTVVTVGNTLNAPSDAEFEQKINAEKTVENFGEDPTIPRITTLDFSNQNSADVSLPTGQRINPFTE